MEGIRNNAPGKKTRRLVGVSELDMLSFCRFYGDQ